jgi:hypothetical protein
MVDEIRLTPREGVLAIDVKGNLTAMLNSASPGEDWRRQITLVAGRDLNPRPLGYEPVHCGGGQQPLPIHPNEISGFRQATCGTLERVGSSSRTKRGQVNGLQTTSER